MATIGQITTTAISAMAGPSQSSGSSRASGRCRDSGAAGPPGPHARAGLAPDDDLTPLEAVCCMAPSTWPGYR